MSDATSEPSAGLLLRDVAAYDLAEHIVDRAQQIGERPVGLYVVDISGGELRRVAGAEHLPQRVTIPRCVGPEIAIAAASAIDGAVRAFSEQLRIVPLWLRHRAIAVLICDGAPAAALDGLALEAAAAIELVDGYTDEFASARRREPVSAAAQLQQDLLPPRIAGARGAELAGCIQPAYDVGGDFFDLAVSGTGAWLAIGDAVGKGLEAAAISALAVGAQRAVRQAGGTVLDAALSMHDAVVGGGREAFMTALLAEWDARDSTLGWLNCGHPEPLLLRAGQVTTLSGHRTLPLGIAEFPPQLRLAQARLRPGDTVLFYSDGVSERRVAGLSAFGVEGIRDVLCAGPASATAVATRLQHAVLSASPEDLRDDATLMVLHVLADRAREPPAPR